MLLKPCGAGNNQISPVVHETSNIAPTIFRRPCGAGTKTTASLMPYVPYYLLSPSPRLSSFTCLSGKRPQAWVLWVTMRACVDHMAQYGCSAVDNKTNPNKSSLIHFHRTAMWERCHQKNSDGASRNGKRPREDIKQIVGRWEVDRQQNPWELKV